MAIKLHRCPATIEFEDGSTYREESADMAKRIQAGQLFEDSAAG
jgi:hypothetical protein